MAEALYRKYRPQTFEDVVGQQHIERTLKNALEADKVSHAYLFCGPRGTGKTTTARLLAKALLCERGPTSSPDGTCQDCRDIADGVHPDVYELDAASRTGVENVRDEIIGRVNYAPTRGRCKVYIIDEVHMLSTAAFNALLKTLEEPPSHVVFILCTTDPQKVPETIHSRCQRFDFHRLSTDEIVSRLGAICVAEGVEFEPEALELVAHRAEGGMRNALTSLEQLIAFGGGAVSVAGAEDLLGSLDSSDMAEIVQAIGKRDIAACFNWTARFVESGADLAQFCRDLAQHVRDLYVLSLAGVDAAIDITEAERREMAAELQLFGPDRLARIMGVLGDAISDLRGATNSRLCFEIALTRIVRPEGDITLEALAERIEALERGGTGSPASPAALQPRPEASAPQPGGGLDFQQAVPREAPRPSAPRQNAVSAAQAPTAPTAPIAAQQHPERMDAGGRVRAQMRQSTQMPQPSAQPPVQKRPIPSPQVQAGPYDVPPAAQPGPVPEETRQAPAESVSALIGNEAALQRLWRSATNAVKREKTAYGALLVGVRVHPNGSGGIALEFPADNVFAYDMAQRPELKTALAQALHTAAGADVPFTIERMPSVDKPRGSSFEPEAAPIPAAPSPSMARARATVQGAPQQPSAPSAPSAGPDDDVPLDLYEAETASADEIPSWEDRGPLPVTGSQRDRAVRSASPSAGLTAEQLGTMAYEAFGTKVTFEEL